MNTDPDAAWNSVEEFLRERGTPITVWKLGQACPVPESVPGKLLKVMAGDTRFEVKRFLMSDLASSRRMVQLRGSLQTEYAEAPSVPTDRGKGASRCVPSVERIS